MASNDKGIFAGLGAAAATTVALAGAVGSLSAPAANLGGYAVAQTLAGALGLPAGPSLSVAIAAIGGPVTAGAAVVAGVGLAVGALVRAVTED